MRPFLVPLVFALAGCVAAPPPEAGAPGFVEGSVTTRALEACGSCNEPTAAWDAAGRLFVATGGGQAFAVSMDGGRSFAPLSPPTPPDGLAISGDVLLQTDAAGRLWWSDLVHPPGSSAFRMRVARSDDGGATWPLNAVLPTALDPLGATEFADRQWLAFDGGTVYAVCTCPGFAAPRVARSQDDGVSWSAWTPIGAALGRPGPIGPPVAADGRLVLPYLVGVVPRGTEDLRAVGVRVVVSADEGSTFESRTVFEADGADVVCCAFPSLGRDAAGRLVVAWSMAAGPVLVSTSGDGGDTWSEPVAFGDGGRYPHPWVAALPDGRLAVAWHAAAGDRVETRLAVSTPEDARVAMPQAETLGDAGDPRSDFAFVVASPAGDRVAVPFSDDGVIVAVRAVAQADPVDHYERIGRGSLVPGFDRQPTSSSADGGVNGLAIV